MTEQDFTSWTEFTSRSREGGGVSGRGHCIAELRGDPVAPTDRRRPDFLAISVNGNLSDQAYVDAANALAENAVH